MIETANVRKQGEIKALEEKREGVPILDRCKEIYERFRDDEFK